jgi:hypothetical protein
VTVGSRASGTSATVTPIPKMRASEAGLPERDGEAAEEHASRHRDHRDQSNHPAQFILQDGPGLASLVANRAI